MQTVIPNYNNFFQFPQNSDTIGQLQSGVNSFFRPPYRPADNISFDFFGPNEIKTVVSSLNKYITNRNHQQQHYKSLKQLIIENAARLQILHPELFAGNAGPAHIFPTFLAIVRPILESATQARNVHLSEILQLTQSVTRWNREGRTDLASLGIHLIDHYHLVEVRANTEIIDVLTP
mmetsp:Transcript_7504/g.10792  ORF Transcript_7504/g.10792 Transcript_7504/m.10792 type:complete len:177 (+) Transcript_7504:77-607(+)